MISPFDTLPLDRALVCEFFAVFSRFEYALKATGFCKTGQFAAPDWSRFQKCIGANLSGCDDHEVVNAIQFLIAHPPQVQKVEGGRVVFRPVDLRGNNDGKRAIEAARRVRNNLFHGGKHTPHSPRERDEKLISCSLLVLQACLKLHPDLHAEFEHQVA